MRNTWYKRSAETDRAKDCCNAEFSHLDTVPLERKSGDCTVRDRNSECNKHAGQACGQFVLGADVLDRWHQEFLTDNAHGQQHVDGREAFKIEKVAIALQLHKCFFKSKHIKIFYLESAQLTGFWGLGFRV